MYAPQTADLESRTEFVLGRRDFLKAAAMAVGSFLALPGVQAAPSAEKGKLLWERASFFDRGIVDLDVGMLGDDVAIAYTTGNSIYVIIDAPKGLHKEGLLDKGIFRVAVGNLDGVLTTSYLTGNELNVLGFDWEHGVRKARGVIYPGVNRLAVGNFEGMLMSVCSTGSEVKAFGFDVHNGTRKGSSLEAGGVTHLAVGNLEKDLAVIFSTGSKIEGWFYNVDDDWRYSRGVYDTVTSLAAGNLGDSLAVVNTTGYWLTVRTFDVKNGWQNRGTIKDDGFVDMDCCTTPDGHLWVAYSTGNSLNLLNHDGTTLRKVWELRDKGIFKVRCCAGPKGPNIAYATGGEITVLKSYIKPADSSDEK